MPIQAPMLHVSAAPSWLGATHELHTRLSPRSKAQVRICQFAIASFLKRVHGSVVLGSEVVCRAKGLPPKILKIGLSRSWNPDCLDPAEAKGLDICKLNPRPSLLQIKESDFLFSLADVF